MSKQKTTEQVINDFKKVHGDKYDYSKTVYKKALEKVIITCPIHGDFTQTPNSHLYGRGCPLCGIEKGKETIKKTLKNKKITYIPDGKRKTVESFINHSKQIHGDKYDYSKVDYINNHTKVCIICPEHGEFWQEPSNHMIGQGCPKCAIEKRRISKLKKAKDFIDEANEIHGYFYKYDKVDYINARRKVTITCPIHGDFEQTPDNHIKGCGCPLCKSSMLEKKIARFLKDNSIKFIPHHSFIWLRVDKQHTQTVDFYLPEYNIAIECQGIQHLAPKGTFGSKKITSEEFFEKVKKLDEKKHDLCEEHKIPILYYIEENIKAYKWKYYKNTDELLEAILSFNNF